MSLIVFGLILITVTLSACAQLALKIAVSSPSLAEAFDAGALKAIIAAVMSPLVWLGLVIYGISVALWLWVLSKVDLSVAYPFVGISFIATMAFGAFLLDESVGPIRIIGTLLIVVGCILVGRSA